MALITFRADAKAMMVTESYEDLLPKIATHKFVEVHEQGRPEQTSKYLVNTENILWIKE